MTDRLKPRDPAPSFALADQGGNLVRLSDYKGRKLLVYFYPEADTPGCTTQSCAVRDALPNLASIGVDAVGISPDLPQEQAAFDEKFGLGFPLLSDPDHAVAGAFGAWHERTEGDKTSGSITRSSFLIDEDGRITHAWYRVKPQDTVPNALKALGQ